MRQIFPGMGASAITDRVRAARPETARITVRTIVRSAAFARRSAAARLTLNDRVRVVALPEPVLAWTVQSCGPGARPLRLSRPVPVHGRVAEPSSLQVSVV